MKNNSVEVQRSLIATPLVLAIWMKPSFPWNLDWAGLEIPVEVTLESIAHGEKLCIGQFQQNDTAVK